MADIVVPVAGPDSDTDGLTVRGHVMGFADQSLVPESRRTQARADVQRVYPEVADVDVVPPATELTTRSDDEPPFNAGGFMRAGPGGQVAETNLSGARVLSSGGYFWMFDGAYNDANGFHKTVTGLAPQLSIGDYVCTSGGNSGARCYQQVNNTNVTRFDGAGDRLVTEAVNTTSFGIAASEGDSGGPVFIPILTNGTGTTVQAAGMIQTGSAPPSYACPSNRALTSSSCFTVVGFSTMRNILSDLGPGARLRYGTG